MEDLLLMEDLLWMGDCYSPRRCRTAVARAVADADRVCPWQLSPAAITASTQLEKMLGGAALELSRCHRHRGCH